MKKIFFLILLVSVALVSCSKSDRAEGPIILSGAFTGIGDGSLTVYAMDEEIAETPIGDHQEFSLRFEYDESAYFTVGINDELFFDLYLKPGDSIHIHADRMNFHGSMEVSGDRAKEALYLRDKHTLDISDPNIARALGSLEPDQYIYEKDQIIAEARQLYDRLAKEKGIDREFAKLEKAFIELTELDIDYTYPKVLRWRNGLSADDPIDFPEEEIQNKIEKLDYNDPSLLKLRIFRNILEGRVNDIASKKYESLPDSVKQIKTWLTTSLSAADSLFKNKKINEYVKFTSLLEMIKYKGPWDFKELYEPFLKNSSRNTYRNSLNKTIEEWEAISPGTEVPDFVFTDITGKQMKLSDLSAKLVYIDVWATWCGPCLREHPYWDALLAEYNEKDIEFLTISIDNTRDPWEKMIKEKEMTGNNWFADNAWQSDLAKYFMIRGIPRFLLLDGERKIVDPSAERPSGNIRQIFDRYL
jgi:thiol-disulfide isomerase/thioredoxin